MLVQGQGNRLARLVVNETVTIHLPELNEEYLLVSLCGGRSYKGCVMASVAEVDEANKSRSSHAVIAFPVFTMIERCFVGATYKAFLTRLYQVTMTPGASTRVSVPFRMAGSG